jgi:hypothetical protein
MKHTPLLSTFIAVLVVGCEGPNQQNEVTSNLTAVEQSTMAIEELNRICPDSYCQRGFDYKFAELACTKKSCTLKFSAEKLNAQTMVEDMLTLKGVSANTIVSNEDGLDYVSDAFYDAFDGALLDWEDTQI